MATAIMPRRMPHSLAKTLNMSCGLILLLGGCTWSSSGPDKGDSGKPDAAPELEHCTLKARACANSCKDLGLACLRCCDRNGKLCDSGDSYSFYSCPDAE